MAVCKYCGKTFKPLGIMRHRVACRKKHENKSRQSQLEVDYKLYKQNKKEDHDGTG